MEALRSFALTFPEVEEGVACLGTPLEKRTLRVRTKAFLFVGTRDVMLKLRDSLPEAVKRAEAEPDRYRVGAHGWVTVTLDDLLPEDLGTLHGWIDESYRLLAPKRLLAQIQSG